MLKKVSLIFSHTVLGIILILGSACAIDVVNMPLEWKIGQMLCLSFRNWINSSDSNFTGITKSDKVKTEIPITEINNDISEIISKYNIGGIILFSENFKNKPQSKKLILDFQKASSDSNNPRLLICIDQEGGKVERFAFNRETLQNNAEIGRNINPKKAAFEKGQIIGKELFELGINCNLAPVVDINSNPKNSVINVRSFGKDSDIVSKCAISFMHGLHSQNIIATAKHFPGHGDTEIDSHLSLPILNKTIQDLEGLELIPFKKMINAGVDMVMTAHIGLPKIETHTITSKKDGKKIPVPATLSRVIINDLLRDKLGFKKVIITDAMNMKAISENISEAEAVKRAIIAGADIICMPVILRSKGDIAKLENIFATIKKAVENNEISIQQIDDSIERILNLKKNI